MILLKLVALLLTSIDVDVIALDGTAITGKLTALSETTVVLDKPDGSQTTVELSSVVEIRRSQIGDNATSELPEQRLLLTNGTSFAVSELALDASHTVGKADWLPEFRIPRPALRAIRMQAMRAEWAAEWNAFLKRENDKDILVRVKRDESGLDFVDGIVGSMNADTVSFLLDGNEIPVPRNRLFGIVLARTDSESPLDGHTTILGPNQSQLHVKQFRLSDDDQLEVVTSWGQQFSLPGSSIRSIDFSSGRFHHLSDLDPVRERYFGTAPPDQSLGLFTPEEEATRTGNASLYRMSRDAFPYGNGGRPPLMLRGKIYRKGLCIYPSARIDYALDAKYSKLVTLVGVDDEVAFNGPTKGPAWAVSLRIEGDGQVLWERLIKAPEDPIPVEVDLTDVRTLSLIVDFGDGQRYCDYLDLVNARLIVDPAK